MRRVKVAQDGNKIKYKMEKFTKSELITAVHNAVYPTSETTEDVNKLLKSVLKK